MAPAPIKRQSEQGAGSAGRGSWDAVVGGGGLASLSAALYLGRSPWRALLIDAGESMARWEPIVENYLGFPEGLSGQKLPELGRGDAGLFAVRYGRDGRQNVSVDDAWQQALEEQGVPVGGEPVNALLHRDG